MSEIIKYKTFSSSVLFEEWQTVKERKISQITPIALDVGAKIDGGEVEAGFNFGVLITYFE